MPLTCMDVGESRASFRARSAFAYVSFFSMSIAGFAYAAPLVTSQTGCSLVLKDAPAFKPDALVSLERPDGELLQGVVLSKKEDLLTVRIEKMSPCPPLLNETLNVYLDESRLQYPTKVQRNLQFDSFSVQTELGYQLIQLWKREGDVSPYQEMLTYDVFAGSLTASRYFRILPSVFVPAEGGFSWFLVDKQFASIRRNNVTGLSEGVVRYQQSISSFAARAGTGVMHPVSSEFWAEAKLFIDYGLSGGFEQRGSRSSEAKFSRFWQTSLMASGRYALSPRFFVFGSVQGLWGSIELESTLDKHGVGPFQFSGFGALVGAGARI